MKKILMLITGVAVCVLVNAGTKPETASREKLCVGVYTDVGARGSVLAYSRLAMLSPDCEAKFIDGAAVRSGALSGVDVLLMSGGSSVDISASLGDEGRAAILTEERIRDSYQLKDVITSGRFRNWCPEFDAILKEGEAIGHV